MLNSLVRTNQMRLSPSTSAPERFEGPVQQNKQTEKQSTVQIYGRLRWAGLLLVPLVNWCTTNARVEVLFSSAVQVRRHRCQCTLLLRQVCTEVAEEDNGAIEETDLDRLAVITHWLR